MKNTRFLELMNGVDNDLLERAAAPKKKTHRKKILFSALAACLALCIALGAIFGGTPAGTISKNGFNIAKAVYPLEEPDKAPYYEYYAQNGGIAEFYKNSISEMLKTENGENALYSPANVYMALAMLAEMTEGETRAQILALLGEESMEELRETASALWALSYVPGEEGTTLIANSVWLNERFDEQLNAETLEKLALLYKASSYSGNFADEAYTEAMKGWTHEQTKNFLKDMAMDWSFDDETVLSFVSTIYFADNWKNIFNKDSTKEMTFYLSEEESVKCDFLVEDKAEVTSYGGEHFIAIRKSFENGGSMLFVLPDWGYTTEDLLTEADFLEFMANPDAWENQSRALRDIRIPKFDVSDESDIVEKLQNLGVTDVFAEGVADFTPLAKGVCLWVGEINHGVRVKIDEKGCTAAGYTQGDVICGTDVPNLVKLDRPFIFAVLTENGIPLFTGVVNNPLKN